MLSRQMGPARLARRLFTFPATAVAPAAMLRRTTAASAVASAAAATAASCTTQPTYHIAARLAHTGGNSAEHNSAVYTQLDELMDSFAEARELIKDAMESVGTTYFAEDMEDAEKQTQDVLQRWTDLQAFLENANAAEELQKLRNMHALKIKQLEAELETVREAGGSG